MNELKRRRLCGSIAQRKGLAKAAVALAGDERTKASCLDLLRQLFHDESEEVRKEAKAIFHQRELYERPGFETFAAEYIKSRAFLDDPVDLSRGLAAHTGRLVRFSEAVFSACAVISAEWHDGPLHHKGHSGLAVDDLSTILLRLYEQSEGAGGRSTRERCLDAWDLMLRTRVGRTHNQLASLDGG